MTEYISVISAMELDEATRARIERNFSEKHVGNVLFKYSVDASVIGGLLIIDGNNYYDSTIAGRLAKIKQTLQ